MNSMLPTVQTVLIPPPKFTLRPNPPIDTLMYLEVGSLGVIGIR
jgi:hypothetical protein